VAAHIGVAEHSVPLLSRLRRLHDHVLLTLLLRQQLLSRIKGRRAVDGGAKEGEGLKPEQVLRWGEEVALDGVAAQSHRTLVTILQRGASISANEVDVASEADEQQHSRGPKMQAQCMAVSPPLLWMLGLAPRSKSTVAKVRCF
jgi:hypothetical protein